MTLDEIEQAVGEHLAALSPAPDIAWPNKDFTPDGEYVEFRHIPNERVDPVISGGYEYQIGIFLLSAVTASGGYSGAANTLAQRVADRFPKALRLAAGGGSVVISAPARFGTPFQDGTRFRVPVEVRYITEG